MLPVSNLTNLIVAARFDFDAVDFLTHLALPSVVASTVGFVAYRAVFPVREPGSRIDDPVDPRALRRGLPIIVFVLAGFVVGDGIGVPPWAIAAAATAWACSHTRRFPLANVPVRAITMVSALAVVVVAASPHLDLARLFDTSGIDGTVTSVVAATALSNIANNLPTTLAATDAISTSSSAWPLLVGANVGSIFLVSGSLSTILWRSAARSNGIEVTARRWSMVAGRVGLPALISATAALCLTAR